MDPNTCPCGEPAVCAVLSPWGELVGYCKDHGKYAIRRDRREHPEMYRGWTPRPDPRVRWRGLIADEAKEGVRHGAA